MRKIFGILLVLSCIFALAFIYGIGIQSDLGNNLIRMHIVANSNSQSDQKIKLLVRDKVLESIKSSPQSMQNDNPYDLLHLNEKKSSFTEDLKAVADNTLLKNNVSYKSRAEITRCYVPQKEYKDICLPEGIYNCLKITLGDGKGENWWCVAYPPLCFTEDMFGEVSQSGKRELDKVLDEESIKAIIKSNNINFRFKIVEKIQQIYHKL